MSSLPTNHIQPDRPRKRSHWSPFRLRYNFLRRLEHLYPDESECEKNSREREPEHLPCFCYRHRSQPTPATGRWGSGVRPTQLSNRGRCAGPRRYIFLVCTGRAALNNIPSPPPLIPRKHEWSTSHSRQCAEKGFLSCPPRCRSTRCYLF